MSGYVASARIIRSTPRLARGGSTDAWRQSDGEAPALAAPQLIDTSRDEPAGSVATDEGRVAAIRERWAQLTFYLFDANAWRS